MDEQDNDAAWHQHDFELQELQELTSEYRNHCAGPERHREKRKSAQHEPGRDAAYSDYPEATAFQVEGLEAIACLYGRMEGRR